MIQQTCFVPSTGEIVRSNREKPIPVMSKCLECKNSVHHKYCIFKTWDGKTFMTPMAEENQWYSCKIKEITLDEDMLKNPHPCSYGPGMHPGLKRRERE